MFSEIADMGPQIFMRKQASVKLWRTAEIERSRQQEERGGRQQRHKYADNTQNQRQRPGNDIKIFQHGGILEMERPTTKKAALLQ